MEDEEGSEVVEGQETAPVEQTETQQEQVQSSEPAIDPNWKALLEKVPDAFHGEITPFLKEWDGNFSKVQSQYAPYKDFAEQKIDPSQIKTALQLSKLLETNPRAVWDSLDSRFNYSATLRGQGQVEEEDEAEGDEDDSDDEDLEEFEFDIKQHPDFLALQEQTQQMQAYLAQQQQAQEEARILKEIDNTWASLEQKFGGKLDQDSRNDIISMTLAMAGPNEAPDLNKGYERYMSTVSRIRNTSANNSAPNVLDGKGGVPAGKQYDFSNPDDVAEYLKANGVGQ